MTQANKPKAEEPLVPSIAVRLSPAKVTRVYDTYWRFAGERQRIFFRRFQGEPAPWTDDPVLQNYKFTNAYRASDRVSQYLIRHVIYRDDLSKSPTEVLFRILLFKFFNRIETWERLEQRFALITYSDFDPQQYGDILDAAMARGEPVYSAAYITPPPGRGFGRSRKHRNHLALLELMMKEEVPKRLVDARSMQMGFELLRSYPSIGEFLAYQFITDINYSPIVDFSEMEFVVPGPGARDGLSKCFDDLGGLSREEMIRFVVDRQEEEFDRLGIAFQDLWGRPLKLIDCQNLFCEVGKYARVHHPNVAGSSGRKQIKQKFEPTSDCLPYWYPPKWGINDRIVRQCEGSSN